MTSILSYLAVIKMCEVFDQIDKSFGNCIELTEAGNIVYKYFHLFCGNMPKMTQSYVIVLRNVMQLKSF